MWLKCTPYVAVARADSPVGPFDLVARWRAEAQGDVGDLTAFMDPLSSRGYVVYSLKMARRQRNETVLGLTAPPGPVRKSPTPGGAWSGPVGKGRTTADGPAMAASAGAPAAAPTTRLLRIRMLRADLLNFTAHFTSAEASAGDAPEDAVATISAAREAPALFFEPSLGRYFLWCSRATGWKANAAEVYSASALSGPWRSEGNPTRHPTSFDSQSTYVLPVTGMDGRARFIYVADRFEPFISGPLCGANLCESGRYVWLPIDVMAAPAGAMATGGGGALRVSWRGSWKPNEL